MSEGSVRRLGSQSSSFRTSQKKMRPSEVPPARYIPVSDRHMVESLTGGISLCRTCSCERDAYRQLPDSTVLL